MGTRPLGLGLSFPLVPGSDLRVSGPQAPPGMGWGWGLGGREMPAPVSSASHAPHKPQSPFLRSQGRVATWG